MSQYEPPYYEPETEPQPPSGGTNGLAVASLVCGLVGFCIPLVGLIGVLMGILGLRGSRGAASSGRGMAVAGLVLGLFTTILWVVLSFAVYKVGTLGFSLINMPGEFTRELSQGEIDAAKARCVRTLDRARLVGASERMKEWGPFESFVPQGNSQDQAQQTMQLTGMAKFARQTKKLNITLIQEDNKPFNFKISDFSYE